MSLTQINKAGLDEIALDHVFTIGASGSSAYTFQGEGLNGTVNNPTLYLTRGKTYRFENGSGGHPIRIQSTSGASGTAYNTGVTNNAGSGTVIVEVQHDAPDVLYYQCTSHAAMNGILYVTGALADGSVTTAKLATSAVTTNRIASQAVSQNKLAPDSVSTAKIENNAVTTSKIADSQIITAKINDSAVTGAKIANGSITTAKIADDQVTEAKIAAGAIGSTEIATNAVTSDKINTGQVTTAKLGDLAVSTAKLGNDAVTSAKIADGAVLASHVALAAINESKLHISNSPTNGYFLSAQSGNAGGLTWAAVNTDLSNDSSPQLGGDLDTNGNNISFLDGNQAKFGTGNDMNIQHSGGVNQITTGNTVFKIFGGGSNNKTIFATTTANAAELYFDNTKKLETTTDGYYYYGTITGGSGARSNAGITQANVHTPAARFFTGGYQTTHQNVTIQATTGNWADGLSSGTHRSTGILFNRVNNNVQFIRAGIQHDFNSTEKFKIHTSYGDIHFRTRNGNTGNQTWEECDRDPLIMHHNGHVSMMHMPRIALSVGSDSSSYSSDMTLHTVTGTASTHGGMTYSNGTITVPYQGVYAICANVGLNTASSNTQRLDLKINGSNSLRTERANMSGWQAHHITRVIELTANSTLQFVCAGRHDSSPFAKISVCMLHGTLTT